MSVGLGATTRRRLRAATAAFLTAVMLTGAIAADASADGATKKPQRPNVVVVMTDDQTLASYREDVMPHAMAMLGGRGTTFTQAVVSTPQCCPSRAGFFTGQYAHNNGVVSNNPGYPSLERPDTVLPAWLNKAGYRTAHIGKFLNGYYPGIVPAPGWDRWRTTLELDYAAPVFSIDGKYKEFDEYLTAVINRQAVSTVEDFSRGRKPFYVQIDQLAPHIGSREEPGRCSGGPIPPPSEESLFAGESVPPTPAIEEGDVSDKPGFIRNAPVATTDQRDYIDLLYGCALGTLPAVDRGIAAVISALRRTGELDRTLIVFTSDNGYSYGEHRVALTKGLGYEEHVRVPMVVRPPKSFPREFRRGATIPAPVANIDIAPTILQLAGAKPLEIVSFENAQDFQNVHFAVVNERLFVEWHLVPYVAEVDVTQFALSAVGVHDVVNVAFGHFGQRADAEFQGVAGAGLQVNELLIKARLIDQPGLRADSRHGWIVRMRS